MGGVPSGGWREVYAACSVSVSVEASTGDALGVEEEGGGER